MLGDHALEAYTRKKNIIARNIAQAELHAAALGESESKGIASGAKQARNWEIEAHRCGLFVDAR